MENRVELVTGDESSSKYSVKIDYIEKMTFEENLEKEISYVWGKECF